jgi:hypothetical protein
VSARSNALFLLLLLAATAALLPFLEYLTDDSFIHFQFAKHLVQGAGYSFNAGEATYGDTSPLWVFLLAAVGKLPSIQVLAPRGAESMPALAWVAKALGWIAHLVTVWILVRLGKRLGWDDRISLGLGVLMAAHAWAGRWALSGMESPLATALVAASLFGLAGVLVQGGSGWWTGIALGLAALTRPECYLLFVLAMLAAWIGRERRLDRALQILGGGALVIVPWLLLAWRWFHTVAPNTAAAKAGALAKPGLAVAALHSTFQIELATDALPLAFLVLVLAFGSRTTALPAAGGRRYFWILCAAWPLLLVLFFAFNGVQVVSRYLLPATPCVLLLGAASMRWVVATSFPRRYGLAVALFVGAFAIQNGIFTAFVSAPSARAHTAGLRPSLVTLGIWARDHTPPKTSFAVADIGAFGYYSERHVVDLYGLVTPVLAPIVVREGYDAVVRECLFEVAGRPEYLIDRHRRRARLVGDLDVPSPYRFLFARKIENLGITRPWGYYYSVYAIDWRAVDETRQRVAEGNRPGPAERVAVVGRRPKAYNGSSPSSLGALSRLQPFHRQLVAHEPSPVCLSPVRASPRFPADLATPSRA